MTIVSGTFVLTDLPKETASSIHKEAEITDKK